MLVCHNNVANHAMLLSDDGSKPHKLASMCVKKGDWLCSIDPVKTQEHVHECWQHSNHVNPSLLLGCKTSKI